MEGKENISAELRLISGFVAGLSRETPYGLPDGYFEYLPGKVLDRIRAGETGEKVLLTGDVMGPSVDPGQSDELLGQPAVLAASSSGVIYSVPEGYFEGFAEKLMNRIKAPQGAIPLGEAAQSGQEAAGLTAREELAQLSSLLAGIDKKMPFQVPAAYFDIFATTLPLEDAGAESWSPLLTGLKNKAVYQAPEGYFTQLPESILGKVRQQLQEEKAGEKSAAPAKVFSLKGRTWWKYSAAAAIAGLILTGSWLWTHTSVKTAAGGVDIARTLPSVSDQDIENYLDTNNITNNSVLLPDELANSTASLDLSDNDVKSFLGEIPDGELKQYIDEHGDEKDVVTN